MTKWIVSTPIKGTNLMKNFVCFTEVELQKLLEQYPEAIVEMKDSHLEDHAPLPLTDDQQVVLDWLKLFRKDSGEDAMDCIYWFVNGEAETSVSLAFIELDNKQQFQVLAAFAEWGLSILDN